ncbi:MAG: hypothetical protein HY241_06130 [Actinobacteria bacterium]|nr:hypothetical protein [Actinomycetota bacterium]
MARTTGDPTVDAILADLARDDPDAAEAARAGFESLTSGEGLASVNAHGLADLLWYQLPVKWICDLDEKYQIAAGLGELFARLGRPRYAAMCTSPTTARVLTTYEHDGMTAGLRAYRAALSASGVEPPDIPDIIAWGSVMGDDEASAYSSVSLALERAIESGDLTPGGSGWRTSARQVTVGFLDSPHDDVTGTTWLQWVNAERLQLWAESRGPIRSRLAGHLADLLTNPQPPPADAEATLAPIRWLLDHAAAGAPLTQTGNLARSIVAEGCRRFDWLTLSGNPRSESDIPELWTLRELARQMGAVRRAGRLLLLSRAGQTLHAAGTEDLWQATMACLPGPSGAEAAAAELALMLLHDQPLDHGALNSAVAHSLTEEGWRGRATDQPVGPEQATILLGDLRRRLHLLHLSADRRLDNPMLVGLREAGRDAARTALRARALRARNLPPG